MGEGGDGLPAIVPFKSDLSQSYGFYPVSTGRFKLGLLQADPFSKPNLVSYEDLQTINLN